MYDAVTELNDVLMTFESVRDVSEEVFKRYKENDWGVYGDRVFWSVRDDALEKYRNALIRTYVRDANGKWDFRPAFFYDITGCHSSYKKPVGTHMNIVVLWRHNNKFTRDRIILKNKFTVCESKPTYMILLENKDCPLNL